MIIFAFFFFFAVSGFYAECPSKKICFNVHIWTKSKFYGMSIGVVNHGEGEGNLDCSMHALQVCVARAAGTAHPIVWSYFGVRLGKRLHCSNSQIKGLFNG